jgi:hypothetical protein
MVWTERGFSCNSVSGMLGCAFVAALGGAHVKYGLSEWLIIQGVHTPAGIENRTQGYT